MTWLFTQVWLWSLAAFLLGSLFTWVLFVLPLKRRLNAIIAEYAHRPPAYTGLPDNYDEPHTALDLFEPQRPFPTPLDSAGGEFPGPGRWEPLPAALQQNDETEVARSRSGPAEPPPMAGFDEVPNAAVSAEPAPPPEAGVDAQNTWFDEPDLQALPEPVATPDHQVDPDTESIALTDDAAEHRVPPYVPPSDSEVTQVIPRISDDQEDSAAPAAPGEQYVIKGHFASRQYHTPDSPQYDHIVAEVWFRSVEDAEQAGFESWNARPAR